MLVGALEGPFGGFELEWARAPAPVRLRPAGRLSDGGRDALGVPVEMRRPGDLAYGAGRLFMASGLGLSAYSRDPATGGLALEGVVDADVSGALLAWDQGRSRLLAHDCGRWTAFGVGGDGALGTPERVPAAGDPAHCGRPLIGAEGRAVHRVGIAGVDLFSVRPDGALRYEGTAPVPGLKGAALGGKGRVYAADADGLLVVGRRGGGVSVASTGIRLAPASLARVPLAVDAGRGLLLAAGARGARLFALGDGAVPSPLGVLPFRRAAGRARTAPSRPSARAALWTRSAGTAWSPGHGPAICGAPPRRRGIRRRRPRARTSRRLGGSPALEPRSARPPPPTAATFTSAPRGTASWPSSASPRRTRTMRRTTTGTTRRRRRRWPSPPLPQGCSEPATGTTFASTLWRRES